jgi:hypothetical protein
MPAPGGLSDGVPATMPMRPTYTATTPLMARLIFGCAAGPDDCIGVGVEMACHLLAGAIDRRVANPSEAIAGAARVRDAMRFYFWQHYGNAASRRRWSDPPAINDLRLAIHPLHETQGEQTCETQINIPRAPVRDHAPLLYYSCSFVSIRGCIVFFPPNQCRRKSAPPRT